VPRRRPFSVLSSGLCLVACAVLSGCGGSRPTPSVGPGPSSKANYIARADAICVAEGRIAATIKPTQLTVGGNPQAAAASLIKGAGKFIALLDIQVRYLHELEKLPQPSADEMTLTKLWNTRASYLNAQLAAQHQLLTETPQTMFLPANAASYQKSTLTASTRLVSYNQQAQSYGFKDCGVPHVAKVGVNING
jgi:hypothetical protein